MCWSKTDPLAHSLAGLCSVQFTKEGKSLVLEHPGRQATGLPQATWTHKAGLNIEPKVFHSSSSTIPRSLGASKVGRPGLPL